LYESLFAFKCRDISEMVGIVFAAGSHGSNLLMLRMVLVSLLLMARIHVLIRKDVIFSTEIIGRQSV